MSLPDNRKRKRVDGRYDDYVIDNLSVLTGREIKILQAMADYKKKHCTHIYEAETDLISDWIEATFPDHLSFDDFCYSIIAICHWYETVEELGFKTKLEEPYILAQDLWELGESNNARTFAQGFLAPMPRDWNLSPVIGILTHPGDGKRNRLSNKDDASNIPASYVRFIQASGARVIPLLYNDSLETLNTKLEIVDGVLLIGGWDFKRQSPSVECIFEHMKKKTDMKIYFPMCAICLGFEILVKLVSKNDAILENFDALKYSTTLQFLDMEDQRGSIFEKFPKDLRKDVQSKNLISLNHKLGISLRTMTENPNLAKFFRVLTTCKDREGKIYVSSCQAKDYPLYAFQWHPEKTCFEWNVKVDKFERDDAAVKVSQFLGNFFVSEVRKTRRSADDGAIRDYLIHNYPLIHSGKDGKGFDELYLFHLNEGESTKTKHVEGVAPSSEPA